MRTSETFPTDRMIYSSEDLKAIGYSSYMIRKLVQAGTLHKLNKRYYENPAYTGEESDFLYVSAYVPSGVICLLSAAVYYDLTTYIPDSIEVAVPRKTNISTLPEFPELHLRYFSEERYQSGIVTVFVGDDHFRIYDIEKTVVDILYYRRNVGAEETKEILTSYLRREDRDLNRLMRYAEKLKCGEILITYLEVLL